MMHKEKIKPCFNKIGIFALVIAFSVGLLGAPLSVLAKEKAISPEFVNKNKIINTIELDKNTNKAVNYDKYSWYFDDGDSSIKSGSSASSAALLLNPPVATVSIFADSDQTGSSGGSSNYYGHAFITIKNNSGSSISVGNLSGIQPNKTVSVGTWGNKAEHTGLWYDLESYFVNQGKYSGRISVSYIMNSSELSTLNSMIINGDYWSYTSNCSTFAKNAWNAVAPAAYDLSAGWPVNTPSALASSIQSVFYGNYSTNAAVPYDYVVYYANGTGAPIRSSVY